MITTWIMPLQQISKARELPGQLPGHERIWKDMEELYVFPVPRDNVSGFLLCVIGTSPIQLSERSARTIGGGGGNTFGEKDRKFSIGFLVSSELLVLYICRSSKVSLTHELLLLFAFNPRQMPALFLKEH